MEKTGKHVIKVVPVVRGNGKKVLHPNGKITLSPVLNARTGTLRTGHSSEDIKELESFYGFPITNAFWQDLNITVPEKGLELDLDLIEHKLKYRVLLEHPFVAKPGEKVNSSVHMVKIYDEYAEAKEKNIKFTSKVKAMSIIAKLSLSEQIEFSKLFGIKSPESLMTDILFNKLVEFAERDPKTFVETYEDKNRDLRILLVNLERAGIITKKGTAYYYNQEVIGANEDLVISYLKETKNQPVLIQLKKLLKSKTGLDDTE